MAPIVHSLCLLLAATVSAQRRNMHILSEIHSKFSVTNVGSDVDNTGTVAREEIFSVIIPDKAFITNLTLNIGSDVIVASIKEASAAKQEYDRAVREGKSASLLKQDVGRGTQYFEVRVNVAAGSRATMLLSYQEILERSSRKYRQFIHIPSDQEVDQLQVDVIITELNKVRNIFVPMPAPGLQAKSNSQLLLRDEAPLDEVFIDSYDMDPADLGNGVSSGTSLGETGSISYITYEPFERPTPMDLMILYDVEHTDGEAGSIIQTVDGHFVHFISPDESETTQGSKEIVFAIDKSGSMRGDKWKQVQAAMNRILLELKPFDQFNIIFFNHIVEKWAPSSMEATQANVNRAIAYVEANKQPMGNTNISGALTEALEVLRNNRFRPSAEAVIFLTDGKPTAGLTDPDQLTRLIRSQNRGNAFIHTLAFGDDADWPTLRKIASENRGLARKIYVDSDADIQLEDFYKEVGAPMLADLDIAYLGRDLEVSSLISNLHTVKQNARLARFNDGVLNDGTEMFIVGKLNEGKESSGLFAVVRGVEFDEPRRPGGAPVSDRTRAVIRSSPTSPQCTPVTDQMKAEMERLMSKADLVKRLEQRDVLCPQSDSLDFDGVETAGAGRIDAGALPAYSIGGFVERFYVAATVARLLDRADTETSTRLRAIWERQALLLSLKVTALEMEKYNLVNRLTSLVAVDDKIRIGQQDFVAPRQQGLNADELDESSLHESKNCSAVKDLCLVYDVKIGENERLAKRAAYFLEDLKASLAQEQLCLIRWEKNGRLNLAQDFGAFGDLISLESKRRVVAKPTLSTRLNAGGMIILSRRPLTTIPNQLKRLKIELSSRVVPVTFTLPSDPEPKPIAGLHPLLNSERDQPKSVLAKLNAAC